MRMFEKRWFTALYVLASAVLVFSYLALAGEISYAGAENAMELYHESKAIAREVKLMGVSGAALVAMTIAALNDMRKQGEFVD